MELILMYARRQGLSYATLAEVDGVLGLTQEEFRRRIVAPYEDKKRASNGDLAAFDSLFGRD